MGFQGRAVLCLGGSQHDPVPRTHPPEVPLQVLLFLQEEEEKIATAAQVIQAPSAHDSP